MAGAGGGAGVGWRGRGGGGLEAFLSENLTTAAALNASWVAGAD